MKIKLIILSVSLLLRSIIVFGQNTTQDDVQFTFRAGSDLLLKDYRNNKRSLGRFGDVLTNDLIVSHIDSIVIMSSASPDGSSEHNYDLAKKRGLAIKNYIGWKYRNIDSNKIHIRFSVIEWIEIKERISNDEHFSYKEKTLKAISNNVPSATIEWRLRRINDGQVWNYLVQNHLWRYTAVTSVAYYLDVSDNPFTLADKIDEVVEKINNYTNKAEVSAAPVPIVEQSQEVIEEIIKEEDVKDTSPSGINRPVEYEHKPLLALKTNLLFDLASLLNIEVEVPIGKRWSVAGEWIFPWWTFDNGKADSPRSRVQLLNSNIEGKYWLGNREDRPQVTGWFIGLYVGGGLYDFEYKAKGYQGEFFIMGGLSGGYAHTINKSGSLRMEYSLGVGYMQTDYRRYEAFYAPNHSCQYDTDQNWHPIRKETGRHTWIGPTKAKVSLIWMLNRKVKKGGIR